MRNKSHMKKPQVGTLVNSLRVLPDQVSGEGNDNPFRCSCLENPVDRGAWRAAVPWVAQSRTRLKRLSMHVCIGEGNGNPL